MALRVARRHTFLVRTLRLALPILVVVSLLLFVGSILLKRQNFGPISYESITLNDGVLVMEGPKLSGLDEESRAYTLTAKQASQKVGQSDEIDLVGIDASLSVDRSTTARVQSAKGVFNQADDTLYLHDGVEVSTDSGYRVQLADANVDLNAGRVSSQKPVTVDMLNGTMNATGIKVVDRGELITFTGRVTMVMQMHGRTGNGKGQ